MMQTGTSRGELPCPVDLQALFCQVPIESVLTMHDVSNIWRVPLLLQAREPEPACVLTAACTWPHNIMASATFTRSLINNE
jgi:hypothetical protein